LEASRLSRGGLDVGIVTKVQAMRSHSVAAEGGTAAVLYPDEGDSFDSHIWDTVKGSDFLADQDAVELFVRAAPEEIRLLERWGMPWSRRPDGRIAQRPFGGHEFPRATFAADKVGFLEMQTLYGALQAWPNVTFHHEWFATSLLHNKGAFSGVTVIELKTGSFNVIRAKAGILATGGGGRIYGFTTHGHHSTADGLHLAYRAGLPLKDMEFVQFHPTGLVPSGILITEAARGEGGYLVNRDGERFIPQDFRRLGWGRSAITHKILHESLSGKGPVGINISHFSPEQRRLLKQVVPIVVENFESAGYDLTKDTIPYTVGVPLGKAVNGAGARINRRGETSVPGLYAAGNCSDGGYIGLGQTLNLCALNGWWAGEAATASLSQAGEPQVPEEQLHSHEESYLGPLKARDGLAFYEVRDKITDVQLSLLPTMNDDKLRGALHRLERAMEEDLPRLAAREPRELVKVNGLRAAVPLLRLSLMVMRHRTESRGNLLREDYPFIDNVNWLVHTVVQKRVNGSLELWDIPIPEEWWVNKPERRQVPHPFFQM